MIGKYVGLLLPLLFGFYGVFSLFGEYDRLQAATYIAQMVIVLYPPFVVFSVLHNHYLRSREEKLLGKLKAAQDVILADRGAAAVSKIYTKSGS